MKKTVLSAFAFLILAGLVSTLFAGGDQNQNNNRGDKGQGEVHQQKANNQGNQK